MYLSVELLHLHLVQFLADQLEPHVAILDHLLQVFLGLQEGDELLLVAGLFEGGHPLCDAAVDLCQILIFGVDEVFDGVSRLLELELHLVHFLYLVSFGGLLGEGFFLGAFAEAEPGSH
jgi:uncharacterized protein YhhL (DUF1145 family)